MVVETASNYERTRMSHINDRHLSSRNKALEVDRGHWLLIPNEFGGLSWLLYKGYGD